ncbi:hypothetical protein FB45DRAFT_883015 [Roridomyces roridus]|uniref:Uncharacterized protein n=1 Tax=Roridomyces roridus TaxID=1738132 RepID=A0AAD7F7W1_9AGAR|nr:hypothetical protein FB45DRAFT_883015 [Roridomyces roridus]
MVLMGPSLQLATSNPKKWDAHWEEVISKAYADPDFGPGKQDSVEAFVVNLQDGVRLICEVRLDAKAIERPESAADEVMRICWAADLLRLSVILDIITTCLWSMEGKQQINRDAPGPCARTVESLNTIGGAKMSSNVAFTENIALGQVLESAHNRHPDTYSQVIKRWIKVELPRTFRVEALQVAVAFEDTVLTRVSTSTQESNSSGSQAEEVAIVLLQKGSISMRMIVE